MAHGRTYLINEFTPFLWMASMDHGEVMNLDLRESRQSPDWVRTSTAAAMTMGLLPGRFYNDAKLFARAPQD